MLFWALCSMWHTIRMAWVAYFHPRFKAEFGVAFVFDPQRNAILLVAEDKSGVSEKKFYKRLIEKADKRYKEHLDIL